VRLANCWGKKSEPHQSIAKQKQKKKKKKKKRRKIKGEGKKTSITTVSGKSRILRGTVMGEGGNLEHFLRRNRNIPFEKGGGEKASGLKF